MQYKQNIDGCHVSGIGTVLQTAVSQTIYTI